MRIIGKTESGFILTATDVEVHYILGESKPYYDVQRMLIGTKIEVSEIYKHLKDQGKMIGQLKDAQSALRRIADRLELPPAIIPVLPTEQSR